MMFGNLNKPAFGTATPNTSFGFGSTSTTNANPFGQNSMFGKPATSGFGTPSTSTFGQPANTSLFPSSQPQSTNLFQNANTTFGAPTTQSGFGSTLFGQQQPSTSGLFNSTSTFGQQNKPAGFGFGTPQAQPSLFGQQQQPAQTSNLFGQQPSTNLFGASGSTFGANQQQTGTVLKFNPVTGTDTMMKNGVAQSINTKHHSITCMKEYEGKSFEELRWEDYQANRKGPQQAGGFGSTAFGAPASSAPSLFGQTDANKPAFGQTTGFGQTTSTFGQNTGFGMGAQQNAGGNLFGKPTAFGTPTSSATSTFGFGNTAQNANPFGAAQNKPFGGTSQPLFGATNQQPAQPGFGTNTGLFGTNTQNTGTGLFGSKPAQPTTGFNQAQNTGFSFNSIPSTQSTGLFQNNKPLFGQTNTSTTGFGATNTFGQPNQQSFGSTFGKPAAPTFGQAQPTGFGTTLGGGLQNQGTSLFGNTAAKPGGLFGTSTGTGLFGNTTSTFQPNTGFGLQTQSQQTTQFPPPEVDYKNLALVSSDPFGDAPHLAGLEPKLKSSGTSAAVATNPSELKSILDASKKVEVNHTSRLKMFPLKSVRVTENLFNGLHKPEASDSPDFGKSNNCRRLIIKNRTPDKKENGGLFSILATADEKEENVIKDDLNKSSENVKSTENKVIPPLRLNFDNTSNIIDTPKFTKPSLKSTAEGLYPTEALSRMANAESKEDSTGSDDEELLDAQAHGDGPQISNPSGIICTRPEYYTLPKVEDLAQYVDENGSCIVKGFTIGRKGYGNVYFPDEMDVSGLNIDELVHFRYREINVYPDESKKPPVGQGLNRKAQVTLDKVYPRKTGSNALIEDVSELLQMNFAEKLQRITLKKGAKFVDYRPETGSWVFKVDHFSRYGYNDSDEEENGAQKPEAKEKLKKSLDGTQRMEMRELLQKTEKNKSSELVASKDNVKFGLDQDIFIDDENQSIDDDDVLSHSMYVDMGEDHYPHNLSMHLTSTIPSQLDAYSSYKNSKAIQVMKSTLFGDDDRSSTASSHMSIIRQYLDLPDDLPTSLHLPTIREEPTKKRGAILRPQVDKVYNYSGITSRAEIIPNRTYLDMGAFKGKSFKVGWSKGFNLMTLNTTYSEINGQINYCLIKINNTEKDVLENQLIDSLKIVLDESSCVLSSDNIPTFKIIKGASYLKRQCELFEKVFDKNNANSKYLLSIWKLCLTLWGPGPNTISDRRHLLSEWLKDSCGSEFHHAQISDKATALSHIFNLLTVFKISEAADLAMENHFPNLSILISQLSITNRTKLFLQEQINNWYNSMIVNHIHPEVKKLYLLLSGIPLKDDINIFENIDWKRAFAMHLWYICPNGTANEFAIELYKEAFEKFNYVEKPLPPYATQYVEHPAFDILYHILLMYKSRIHRLSSVLNPATHTDDPLDYRLSWLLLQLFLSLDVGLIEPFEISKITISFSNQLENLGHWEWAIYVLLHLDDNSLKKKLVMSILERNLSPDSDLDTIHIQNELVNNMNVPPEWIHLVKAEKNMSMGQYIIAFNHFTHAREYITANNIMIEHILPELFINEQFDLVKMFIDAVRPGYNKILKWNFEAGLFSDFLELQEKVISGRVEDFLRLESKLQSISDRIGGFPKKNDQQKLCVAEIAKRAASIYKELCKGVKSELIIKNYLIFVEGLEMPPDFKQVEQSCLISNI